MQLSVIEKLESLSSNLPKTACAYPSKCGYAYAYLPTPVVDSSIDSLGQ